MFSAIVIVGCASTEIISRHEYEGERIARPDHIIVYDFVATPSDVPPNSVFAGQYGHSSPQTEQHNSTGRQVGAEIASVLVDDIRNMGLPAERDSSRTKPRKGDLVIRGYPFRLSKAAKPNASLSDSAPRLPI